MRQSGKVSKTVNFVCRLAQNAWRLLVASHAVERIERFLVDVIVMAPRFFMLNLSDQMRSCYAL